MRDYVLRMARDLVRIYGGVAAPTPRRASVANARATVPTARPAPTGVETAARRS